MKPRWRTTEKCLFTSGFFSLQNVNVNKCFVYVIILLFKQHFGCKNVTKQSKLCRWCDRYGFLIRFSLSFWASRWGFVIILLLEFLVCLFFLSCCVSSWFGWIGVIVSWTILFSFLDEFYCVLLWQVFLVYTFIFKCLNISAHLSLSPGFTSRVSCFIVKVMFFLVSCDLGYFHVFTCVQLPPPSGVFRTIVSGQIIVHLPVHFMSGFWTSGPRWCCSLHSGPISCCSI